MLETIVNNLERQLDAQGIPEDVRGEDVEARVLTVVNEKMGVNPPLIPPISNVAITSVELSPGWNIPVPSSCVSSRIEFVTRSITPEAR